MFNLPQEINHYILLFLLDKEVLLKKSKRVWCHCCGEQIVDGLLCDKRRCKLCCRLHCLDKTNYYKDYSNAPPYRDDEIVFALKHCVSCCK